MKETFQLVRLQDGKHDLAEIVATLRDIKSGRLKNDLKLLNYYHEVPISYPAKLDTISDDSIELSTNQAQSVVLGLQKQALLTSTAFPQGLGVHAFVEYINVKNCFAVLGRFAYASVRADRRGAVRVRVGEHIRACFQADQQSFGGEVIDVSISGVAIRVIGLLPVGIAESGSLQLDFQTSSAVVPAKIVKTTDVDGECICKCMMEPDSKADKLISQYIFSRQVEIIRDLKAQYQ